MQKATAGRRHTRQKAQQAKGTPGRRRKAHQPEGRRRKAHQGTRHTRQKAHQAEGTEGTPGRRAEGKGQKAYQAEGRRHVRQIASPGKQQKAEPGRTHKAHQIEGSPGRVNLTGQKGWGPNTHSKTGSPLPSAGPDSNTKLGLEADPAPDEGREVAPGFTCLTFILRGSK